MNMICRLRILWLCLALCAQEGVFAQAEASAFTLVFQPQFQQSNLVVDETRPPDSLDITAFRCYISAVALWRDGRAVWSEPESYHLLDAAKPASMQLALNVPDGLEFDALHFLMGIDSATSMAGAFGGDLDPTLGMYWTWQSGYIHFKLEGFHPASGNPDRSFGLHLGGYQGPYATVQPVALPCANTRKLRVGINLDQFLQQANLAEHPSVLSEGERSRQLSVLMAQLFFMADAE
ncbi:MAG: MbnP family protein [Bacteroidota bacterium]